VTRCIHEVREFSELESYREAWQRLHAITPNASFFQSIDWFTARLRHGMRDLGFRVLIVQQNGEVQGIVPLVIQRETTRLGPVRVLTFPLDGWGSFYGPLGADPLEMLTVASDYLESATRDYDLIDLRDLIPPCDQVASTGETVASVTGISGTSGRVTGVSGSSADPARIPASFLPWQTFSVIDLDRSWEAYWESRKQDPNRRRNITRCERRLEEAGQLEYFRYRPGGTAAGDDDPRWDLFEKCVTIAARSWQSGLVEGNTLSHGDVYPLLRDVHFAAARAGGLDVNLLKLNGTPIAFAYGYHFRGHVDVMRIGFDPEWSKMGPGSVLWTRQIRDSIERGDRMLDLGPTAVDYKKFWMTRRVSTYRCLRYTHSPRAQLLRLARWIRGRAGRPLDTSNSESKQHASESAAKCH